MTKKKERKPGSGGSRLNAGRKSREERGLNPTITTGVRIEPEIRDKAVKNHGSLANAIRFAAKSSPEDFLPVKKQSKQ